MNIRDTLRSAMFGRVAVFGEAHAADFAPDSEGGKRFASLLAPTVELPSPGDAKILKEPTTDLTD